MAAQLNLPLHEAADLLLHTTFRSLPEDGYLHFYDPLLIVRKEQIPTDPILFQGDPANGGALFDPVANQAVIHILREILFDWILLDYVSYTLNAEPKTPAYPPLRLLYGELRPARSTVETP